MQMDLWKILEKNMDQKQELRKRMKEKRDRISPQERRQKSAKICERCCDGHVHHAAALASEAPAQPNDPYARADRSFPDPGKLPVAGNHG